MPKQTTIKVSEAVRDRFRRAVGGLTHENGVIALLDVFDAASPTVRNRVITQAAKRIRPERQLVKEGGAA